MADYDANKKATQLDVLTALANDDVIVVGDTSDSGKAKAITKTNLKVEMESGLVNATATDTTADYLDEKIEITSDDGSISVTKTIQDAGTDEKIIYDLSVLSGGGGGSGGGGTKLAIDTTAVTVTASTTETTLFTVSIPGGTLGTNNAIYYRFHGTHDTTGGAGSTEGTFRVKYGGTTIATFTSGGSAAEVDVIIEGSVIAHNATNAQKAEAVSFANLSLNTRELSTAAVDSTVAQDLVITVQNQNVVDTSIGQAIVVQEIGVKPTIDTYITDTVGVATGAVSALTLDTNTVMAIGLISIPNTLTVTDISCNVTTVDTAGTISYALYTEDGASLVLDETTASIAGTGIDTTTIIPVTVAPGNYYLGVHSNGTTDIAITQQVINSTFGTFSGNIIAGTLTITASTTPATIDPTTITFAAAVPSIRFDA